MNPSKFQTYDNRPVCDYIYNAKQLLSILQKIKAKDYDDVDEVIDELYLPCSYLEDNLDRIQECVDSMERRLFCYRNAIEDLGFVRMDGK